MQDLARHLRSRIRGEVHLDLKHRVLYATDASLYQQEPRAVVLPRDAADVEIALEVAADAGIPVLPRGAGTSLAGQTTCEGALVLDFSRHMDSLVAIDPEARRAVLQPGVTLDALNREAGVHGLQFGPDVATSSRATLGGMCGNNSCGARSLLYGKTVDHVLAADVLLATGERLRTEPVSRAEARARARRSGAEGRVFGQVLEAVDAVADEVRRRFPAIPRRVSGYNLDALVGGDGDDFDLARLLVGSEGTLAVAVALEVRLVEAPRARGLAVVRFPGLIEALRATPRVKEEGPASVEVLDSHLLRLTKASPGFARNLAFLEGEPGAVLVVEFHAEDPARAEARLAEFARRLRREGIGEGVQTVPDPALQAAVWEARKAGLGLLMSMKGDARPVAFVEDTAVPPDRLADYMEEFLALVAREGAQCAVYGHAAAGCLHTRPILAVKEPEGRARLARISEGVAELVLRYGGCLSGEHGDGLSRSRYLEAAFGPRIVEAFARVKAAFDPEGRMNPGKITSAPSVLDRMRYGPGYRARPPRTAFRFAREGGMDRAVELCNGMAACRKRGTGVMCPSFMAVREEEHSTRGRANLLRAALDGRLPLGLASPELGEALSLCLECKACKTECPAQVDMARLKAETLHQARGGRPAGAADRLFGRIDRHAALASRWPSAANWLTARPIVRRALHTWAGVDARRPLPPLARMPLSRLWDPEARPRDADLPVVALFVDTFTEHFQPEVGLAAVAVLEAAGCRVVPSGLGCCGRTRISRGLLDEARRMGSESLGVLEDWASRGVPVVGLEPSCVLTLRDDLPDLDPRPGAREAVAGVLLLEEFLAGRPLAGALGGGGRAGRCLVHVHCHQRALVGVGPTLDLLRGSGAAVEETGAGCCGMAGAFGYEHYEVSAAVAADRLVPAVREAGPGTAVVASGFSCRQQIAHLTGIRALHPAEVLAQLLHQP